MKIIPFVRTFIMVVPFLFAPAVLAQSNPIAAPVATVNIQDAKIVSQKEHDFTISFSLSNREGMQSGVRYGVRLVANTAQGQVLVDEKIYPEVLTLLPNTTVQKEISYTAPAALNGTYALVLYSGNAGGFPFGVSYVGDVTLYSDMKGVFIAPDSCSLAVQGEANQVQHRLFDGVFVMPNQPITAVCTATNTLNRSVTLTPSYTTYLQSAYGEKIAASNGSVLPVTIASGEKKTFSVRLPNPQKPQFYTVQFMLTGPEVTTNTITASYGILGDRAIIANATLDKNRYVKGETYTANILWSGYGVQTLGLSMVNQYGRSCTEHVTHWFNEEKNPVTTISFPITKSCNNPKLTITLSDKEGVVLDQKEFVFNAPMTDAERAQATRHGVIVTIIALIVAGVGIYLNRRHAREQVTTTTL